jgi:hypothetical protein
MIEQMPYDLHIKDYLCLLDKRRKHQSHGDANNEPSDPSEHLGIIQPTHYMELSLTTILQPATR